MNKCFFHHLGEPSLSLAILVQCDSLKNDKKLLRLFCGNHYTHLTLQRSQLHTHHSTVLTYNQQRKCAGSHHYIMYHSSPSTIQSQGRQGQPAIQSHPFLALIITLGPLERESGSPGPEIVARKRLYRAKKPL